MATEQSFEDFANIIRASVDHATHEVGNHGKLWKEYNGDLDHVQYLAPTDAILK
ncbi:MAG: hypothetical protein JWN33_265 [Candidatus Saccharibacteria bacterium]|nr:hypothetical protein [Candidatus Saccharibacteria bacterium]